MKNVFELRAREEFGKQKAKKIRKGSLIPGVIYGDKIKNRHFTIDPRQIDKMRKHSEGEALIDVKIGSEKEPVKVIIQAIQKDSVKGVYEHIDLYQVRMDKKLHTDIHLEFIGESKAVEDLSGSLVKQYDKLPIECLPKDLINVLEVSIDNLDTFDDVIRVKDLNLPEGVETHLDSEEIVASVAEPRTEEELEDLEAEVKADVDEIEVTGEKKKEEGEEVSEEGGKSADSDGGKDEALAKENKK
ncbi:50S ribosomal protein L25 [Patescibacteria group bacterium]|nr:50S ribosomal protein L25 [Patescibacteria group bacterium]